MEKLLVTVYIMVFLGFCLYVWGFLKRDEDKNLHKVPRIGTKEYYKKKYLYHSKMSDQHAKEAQRALRKYKRLASKRGRWR